MELSQLRYFITLAEELHFGRATAGEHIVQSAVSQQLQRLERELGLLLLDCTIHHVELTPARSPFPEGRQVLAQVDRAALAAQRAASSAPVLPMGVVGASYDSMPQVLRDVPQYPELDFHQVEAGVPEQFRQLASGRPHVGIGWASLAPVEVASELVGLDPLGVLAPEGDRLDASEVPVAKLAAQLAPSRRSCAGVAGAA